MSWLPWILNRQLLLHFYLCYSHAGLGGVDFKLDSSFFISFESFSAHTQQVSGRLTGQLSTYIPLEII